MHRYLSSLYDNFKKHPSHNEPWTPWVIDCVRKVGKNYGYDVRPDPADAASNEKEWLLDCCWLKRDKRDNNLQRLILAFECEYGMIADILYDFEKILVSTAEFKVMMFNGETPAEVDVKFNALKSVVGKFKQHINRSRILLIGQSIIPTKFYNKYYICNSNGITRQST